MNEQLALLFWHLVSAELLARQIERTIEGPSERRVDLQFVRFEVARAKRWAELALERGGGA
jgi:hypothetical protein